MPSRDVFEAEVEDIARGWRRRADRDEADDYEGDTVAGLIRAGTLRAAADEIERRLLTLGPTPSPVKAMLDEVAADHAQAWQAEHGGGFRP